MSHAGTPRGKKRPRSFHRGTAAGKLAVPKIDALEQAEQRARTTDSELRAVAARYREDVDVWQDGLRAAPFVPRLEAAL